MKERFLNNIIDDLMVLRTALDSNNERKDIRSDIATLIIFIEQIDTEGITATNLKYKKIKDDMINNSILNDEKIFNNNYGRYNIRYDDLQSLLLKILNISGAIEGTNLTPIEITKEEYCAIAKDFFKELDSDYFSLFNKVNANGQICIDTNDMWNLPYGGLFVASNYLRKVHIFVNKNNFLSNLITLTHEFQHAFDYEFGNYQKLNTAYWDYCEVSTMFMELVFVNYLKEKKLFLKQIHEQEQINIIQDYNRANDIYDQIITIKTIGDYCNSEHYNEGQIAQLYANNEKIKELLEAKGFNPKEDKIEFYKNYDGPHQLIYLTNRLIAGEIFEIYMQDKEYAINMIKYISKSKDKDPVEVFNDLGIDINYNHLLCLYEKHVSNVMGTNELGNSKLKIQHPTKI